MKTIALLLFATGFYSPLLAQKKLALANECFDAKAFYLASRYYQAFFEKNSDPCHPDQIKLAQSLAATQELASAETIFKTYMDCQKRSPNDHIVYGKFLIDIEAYEKAIPYFERAMITEPQLARHYLLVCQTALPKQSTPSSIVFINQSIQQNEVQLKDRKVILVEPTPISMNTPTLTTASAFTKEHQVTLTVGINAYDSSISTANKNNTDTSYREIVKGLKSEHSTTTDKGSIPLVGEKKFSLYGVRLGAYKSSTVPNLASVEGYGRIEQKKWKGKIIVFLVDFPNRVAAEATVEIARQENFESAVLVKKLSSGRMKSVR